MLYLFYGKDKFRIRARVKEVIEEWKEKYGENGIINIEGSSIDYFDLRSQVFSGSIFSLKKLIIINNISSNIKTKEAILKDEEVFSTTDNLILFIEDDIKPGKTDSFILFLKKKAGVEVFDFLKDDNLRQWINNEASKQEIRVKEGVVNLLINVSKGDLFKLHNDLKKLFNYVIAENRTEVTLADADKLIDKNEEGNVFAITDAIGMRNKRMFLILIDNYLKSGGVILILFATITTHIKNLISVKEFPMASPDDLGMKPFVKMKCSGQAKNFDLTELKQIFESLIELDRKMKVGEIGQEEAIEMLIFLL